MSLAWIGTALTVVALVALLVAEYRGSRQGKWIAKPLASTGFVIVGMAGIEAGSSYDLWLGIGLVLAWLGDVLLIPEDRRSFLAGLVSFLLGHVAYALACATLPRDGQAVLLTLFTAAVVGMVLARLFLGRIDPGMRGPVVVYAVVISVMLALAVGATVAGAWWGVAVGAGLFWFSDLSVAWDRLISPSFRERAWGLPAYYGGQLLLAWSILHVP